MRVKYLGPRDSIGVAGHGEHLKDEVKDYPDEVGVELVTESKRQHFEAVDGLLDDAKAMPGKPDGAGEQAEKGEDEQGGGGEDAPPEELSLEERTVAELTAMCEERGIEVPKKAKKAELIELLKPE